MKDKKNLELEMLVKAVKESADVENLVQKAFVDGMTLQKQISEQIGVLANATDNRAAAK